MVSTSPEGRRPVESRIFGTASDKFQEAERRGWLYFPGLDHLGRPLNKPTAAMRAMATTVAIEVSKLDEARFLVTLLRLHEGEFPLREYVGEEDQVNLQVGSVPAVVVRARSGLAQVEFHNPDEITAMRLSPTGDNIFLGALHSAEIMPALPTEPTEPPDES